MRIPFGVPLTMLCLLFTSNAYSEEPWEIKRVDMNTIIVNGSPPGLPEFRSYDMPGVFTPKGRDDTIVIVASPAMIDHAVQLLQDPDFSGMIVGQGRRANAGDYPWQVALAWNRPGTAFKNQFCGGVLISKDWVLTAAHCVYNSKERTWTEPPAAISVVAGNASLNENLDVYRVKKILIHESWTRGDRLIPLDNDIALLELATPVELSEHISPIPLMGADHEVMLLSAGSVVRVVGWGMTDANSPASKSAELLWADIEVISHADCARITAENGLRYSQLLTANMFCASREGDGACSGDSGSGTFSRHTSPPTLVGLVSWAPTVRSSGVGCTTGRSPGVFTKISRYSEWIKAKTNQEVRFLSGD